MYRYPPALGYQSLNSLSLYLPTYLINSPMIARSYLTSFEQLGRTPLHRILGPRLGLAMYSLANVFKIKMNPRKLQVD